MTRTTRCQRLHTFTIGRVEPDEAESKANQVDYLLMRIRQGLLTVPPETDIVVFLQHDGKPPEPTLPTTKESAPVAPTLTLGALRDRYLRTHENGSLEQTTIDGIHTHFRHLVATLGERFPIRDLGMGDLQKHVDRRARMKGLKNGKLSPATIKKEIISLRTVWNWGVNTGDARMCCCLTCTFSMAPYTRFPTPSLCANLFTLAAMSHR